MKALLTLCLLLPLAGLAAPPPAATSSETAATEATTQQQLAELQARMSELASRMAVLSAKIGNDASATALRYLADSQRGMLGMAVSHDGNSAYIDAVTPDGPAERAGLKAGDEIIAIDGKPLAADGTSASERLEDLQPGKALRLTVRRDGKVLHINATPERFQSGDWEVLMREATRAANQAAAQVDSAKLQQRLQQEAERAATQAVAQLNSPESRHRMQLEIDTAMRAAANARTAAIKAGHEHTSTWQIMSPWWGLNLAALNPDLGRYFGTDHGALVLSRDASRYPELEPGDVITQIGKQSITNPQGAMRAFGESDDDQPVAITVRRHGKDLALRLKSPPDWQVLPPAPPPAPPVPPLPPVPAVPPVPPPPGSAR